MNWYPYIPSLISIYLIFISTIFSGLLKSSVDNFVTGKGSLEDNKGFIQNVALDWVARINFVNSMVVSIVSVFTIYASLRNYDWAFLTFIPLFLVFIPMFLWIMRHNPGDLQAIKYRHLKITHAAICSIILLFVNLVLVGAIFLSQWLAKT